MRIPSSDGVTIEVHDLGGSGEPFLVCHATGFLGMAYEAMAADLRDRFHVYAMDFRGHGDSGAPANGRFDWGAMADDLLAVAAALTDRPLAAFGHSMGGASLMLGELRSPGLLDFAYLFEPIVIPDGADVAGLEGLARGLGRRPSGGTRPGHLSTCCRRACSRRTLRTASARLRMERSSSSASRSTRRPPSTHPASRPSRCPRRSVGTSLRPSRGAGLNATPMWATSVPCRHPAPWPRASSKPPANPSATCAALATHPAPPGPDPGRSL